MRGSLPRCVCKGEWGGESAVLRALAPSQCMGGYSSVGAQVLY